MWKPEHLRASEPYFSPWPFEYFQTRPKWLPLYWPNQEWQVISSPPAFDELGNRMAPRPPEGAVVPWWLVDKEDWPIQEPWEPMEPEVLCAWQASKLSRRPKVGCAPKD